MGRKSYSRQAMQKFTQSTDVALPMVIPGYTEVRVLDFIIPEEVIVKRFVVNVNVASSASGIDDGSFCASLVQSDSANAAAGDPLDENRLIRSASGTAGTPLNLDDTITMRKLAGSGVHLYIANVSNSSESYFVKATLHYLEV